MMTVLQTAGLSHSEIRGSKVICTLPRLIAAYHVLHRLREPRHPPCALFYFLGRRYHLFRDIPQLILSAVSWFILMKPRTFSLFEFHSTVSCVNMSKISIGNEGFLTLHLLRESYGVEPDVSRRSDAHGRSAVEP